MAEYRLTIHVTIDVEADHTDHAFDKAVGWMEKHAPAVDYVIDDEIERLDSGDYEPPDEYKYRLELAALDAEDRWAD